MNQLTYAELRKKVPFRMFKIERPVLNGGNDLRAKREHFEAFSSASPFARLSTGTYAVNVDRGSRLSN
jgi:hypothetical protein